MNTVVLGFVSNFWVCFAAYFAMSDDWVGMVLTTIVSIILYHVIVSCIFAYKLTCGMFDQLYNGTVGTGFGEALISPMVWELYEKSRRNER